MKGIATNKERNKRKTKSKPIVMPVLRKTYFDHSGDE